VQEVDEILDEEKKTENAIEMKAHTTNRSNLRIRHPRKVQQVCRSIHDRNIHINTDLLRLLFRRRSGDLRPVQGEHFLVFRRHRRQYNFV